MWLISIILILISYCSKSDFFVGISDTIKTLHHLCLIFTPNSVFEPYYAAVICGQEISKNISTLDAFKKLGIYYFLIISGTHLSFISAILEHLLRMKRSSFSSLIALGIFSLITGFDPPVVRSFASLLIDIFQKKFKLFWTPSEVAFLALCLCLALNPSWKESFSMILSHAAYMAIVLTMDLNFMSRIVWIYILIFPFLLPLEAPHVFSIFSHAVLSVVFETVLYPLSLLAFPFHFLTPLSDFFWKWFLQIITWLAPYLPTFEAINISKNVLWIMTIALSFYGIYKEKKWNTSSPSQ